MPGRKTAANVYQLKVTLRDSHPPIWRRLQVPGNISLYTLHQILQVVMGWTDSHLHEFTYGENTYRLPSPYDGALGDEFDRFKDERRARLDQVAPREGAKLMYQYDFGDSWDHAVLVEKILPPEPGVHYPRCLTGRRAGPPEDCGGIWGYEHLVEVLQDPANTEYEELHEWVGEDFDPVKLSVDEINEDLKAFR